MNERPLIVYGRLLEAFHLSGYAFERAYAELEYMLTDDRWIETGFDTKNDFVRSIDLSKFKHSVEQRKRFAALMKDADVSQRATAKMLGVHERTVRRDVGADAANAAPATEKAKETADPEIIAAANAAPARPEWWQQDIDPARVVEAKATTKAKRCRTAHF